MELKKLLVTEGGGIVPNSALANQSEKNTNVFIGLGGTGKDCLKAIKREMYSRLQSDNPAATVKTYKNASFLCIDSDDAGTFVEGAVDSFRPGEFYPISTNNISAFVQSPSLASDPAFTWLKTHDTEGAGRGITIDNTRAGAAGVRQAGRALLFKNIGTIKTKITTLITNAKMLLPQAKVKIHVFTGIGGGTGAGSFLDICYLIREILRTNTWDADIFGYFFLPDVNLSNPKLGEAAKEMIQCTGYASMKELDYCMNFKNNGGKWDQFYGGAIGTITSTLQPVDYAFLITATDAGGRIQPNPYKYAMSVVSNFVTELLIDQSGSTHDIDSFISNIPTLITHTHGKTHGANYPYLVLGAACSYMPYVDIATYMSAKLFAKFSKVKEKLPLESEVKEFLKKESLTYDDILRDLTKDLTGIRMYAVDIDILYDQAQSCATSNQYPRILEKMFDDDLSRNKGTLASNKSSLLEKLDRNLIVDGSVKSLINRIYKALIGFAGNIEQGPYYAAAFLHSVMSYDIPNAIKGMITENDTRLSHARANLRLRDTEYGEALTTFKSARKANKKKGERLVIAFNSWCKATLIETQLEEMAGLLTEFKIQIDDLYSKYFGRMTSLFDDLKTVFEANVKEYEHVSQNEESFSQNAQDIFSKKIMSIDETDGKLKALLENKVKGLNASNIFSDFITTLARNDDWVTLDPEKTASLINDFFSEELRSSFNASVDDYLAIKYDTTVPGELEDRVYQNIIIPTMANAAPLFWQNAQYDISNASSNAYCSVPSVSATIQHAMSTYIASLPEGSKFEFAPDADPGRICFVQMRCGIPFYGYQGLYNYSSAIPHVGRYIYEGSKRDGRDFGVNFSIIPLSCIRESEKTKACHDKERTIRTAFEYGVLHDRETKDKDLEFYIRELDEKEVSDQIDALSKSGSDSNVDRVQAVLNKVLGPELFNALMQEISKGTSAEGLFGGEWGEKLKKSFISETGPEIFVPTGADRGYEETFATDMVFSYDALYDCAKHNTQLAEKKYAAIKECVSALLKRVKGSALVQDFAEALCCGVIKISDNGYTFSYVVKDSLGFENETQISTITSAPFGADLPLYSAFLNYSALDDDALKAISQAVLDLRMNALSGIQATTEEINQMFITPSNVNSMTKMIARTNAKFSLQAGDIMQFIAKFKQALEII